MLQPAFSFGLNYKVLPKTVALGTFDGANSCLCGGAANGKIHLHAPRSRSLQGTGGSGNRLLQTENADVSVLNINQSVKALAVGRLQPGASNDIIIVGTPSHVLAYDVEKNADLFYKEVPDGVNVIVVGHMGGVEGVIALCGGNCALQGFDYQGNDVFWTVTGDNVCSLCFCDFDRDGKDELIVGSEDFDIRVFKGDEIIAEMTETEAVVNLYSLEKSRFAYALANGTLGVYEGVNRVWRIKSKNQVYALGVYDIDGNGEKELVTGWSNGKVDFRSTTSGEVVIKDQFSSGIAGIAVADYRKDGRLELICCTVEGEVRGFLPMTESEITNVPDPAQEMLHDLSVKKQNLLLELKNYEENMRISEHSIQQRAKHDDGHSMDFDLENIGAIPANTQLQTTLYINPGSETEQPCVELFVSTSNDTLVRSVMVFAEGIFPGESHSVHASSSTLTNNLKIHLRPEKDIAVDLHVKALVGYKQSVQYHVFELSRTLPKFAMYALCNDNAPQPQSYVTFTINERPQRIALWVNDNFLLQEEVMVKNHSLDARFFSLRGSGMLFVQMEPSGQLYVRCDDMDVCCEIIQALAEFLGLENLQTTAEFPHEIEKLLELLTKINDVYAVRDRMSADVADRTGFVKGLLVRAEDSRLLGDMIGMRRNYNELHNINQEIISQFKIRCNNQDDLKSSLKQLNQIIQRAGRLRVGRAKTDVINACRNAIKAGNAQTALPKIIRVGA